MLTRISDGGNFPSASTRCPRSSRDISMACRGRGTSSIVPCFQGSTVESARIVTTGVGAWYLAAESRLAQPGLLHAACGMLSFSSCVPKSNCWAQGRKESSLVVDGIPRTRRQFFRLIGRRRGKSIHSGRHELSASGNSPTRKLLPFGSLLRVSHFAYPLLKKSLRTIGTRITGAGTSNRLEPSRKQFITPSQ